MEPLDSVPSGSRSESRSSFAPSPSPATVQSPEATSPAPESSSFAIDLTASNEEPMESELGLIVDLAAKTAQNSKRRQEEEEAEISAKRAKVQNFLSAEVVRINSDLDDLYDLRKKAPLSELRSKELKHLLRLKSMKNSQLRKLQQTAGRMKKYRRKTRAKLRHIKERYPEVIEEAGLQIRDMVGRPSKEEEYPELHAVILEIVTQDGAADPKRRTEIIECVRTLKKLKEALAKRGIELSESALSLRLLPVNKRSHQAKRHVSTVPVRRRRAQNNKRNAHKDADFAFTSIGYMNELAGVLGNDCVFYLSQDDKARVPLGLPAANKQAPILMGMEYGTVVKLPDHDWVLGPRMKLIPSVYGAMMIESGRVSYSGATYVAIRSGRHDSSTAASHAVDFTQLMNLTEFEGATRDHNGEIKPILVVSVDGGPDESPKNPKTLQAWAGKFHEFDFDNITVGTHAPHQSAYNKIERRMPFLSRQMAGIILPHDSFGSHLDGSLRTVDVELEKHNFAKAGRLLGDLYSELVIDKYPVVSEYVDPVECSSEWGSLDPKWCATHVRQSQYMLQISKCGDLSCCKPARSNFFRQFPRRFLPPPIKIVESEEGIIAAPFDCVSAKFAPLLLRLTLDYLEPEKYDEMPFDFYCPSLQDVIEKRICKECDLYFPSVSALKSHKVMHRESFLEEEELEEEEEEKIEEGGVEEEWREEVEVEFVNAESDIPVYKNIFDLLQCPFENLE